MNLTLRSGTTITKTFLLFDGELPISKSKSPALAVSITFISMGALEVIDEVTATDTLKETHDALLKASEALDEMQRRRIPGLDEALGQGTAVSEVAGPAAAIGSILRTMGMIANIMDELSTVRSHITMLRDTNLS